LLKWTEAQADQIASIIQLDHPDFECLIGMRYFDPCIDDAIVEAYSKGFRRIIFLPMFPQYSTATNGSAFEVARKSCARYRDLEDIYIDDFHDNERYVSLLQKYINANINKGDTLLFSAHSLPQKFVDEGDPYVNQIKRTCALAAGEREYFLSFQSRTGPVKWVGPDTIDETKRLLSERTGNLFIVPVAFVCDHIETLYEIDIELPGLIDERDRGRIRRMPMFNADSEFAGLLAELISKRVYD
jgi:ferrochelatase